MLLTIPNLAAVASMSTLQCVVVEKEALVVVLMAVVVVVLVVIVAVVAVSVDEVVVAVLAIEVVVVVSVDGVVVVVLVIVVVVVGEVDAVVVTEVASEVEEDTVVARVTAVHQPVVMEVVPPSLPTIRTEVLQVQLIHLVDTEVNSNPAMTTQLPKVPVSKATVSKTTKVMDNSSKVEATPVKHTPSRAMTSRATDNNNNSKATDNNNRAMLVKRTAVHLPRSRPDLRTNSKEVGTPNNHNNRRTEEILRTATSELLFADSLHV